MLALRDGQWALLRGGGATSGEDLLADRPAVLPDYPRVGCDAVTGVELQVILVSTSGGVRDDRDEADRRPESGRWINYADVRVNSQVTCAPVSTLRRRGRVPLRGPQVRVGIVAAVLTNR